MKQTYNASGHHNFIYDIIINVIINNIIQALY